MFSTKSLIITATQTYSSKDQQINTEYGSSKAIYISQKNMDAIRRKKLKYDNMKKRLHDQRQTKSGP